MSDARLADLVARSLLGADRPTPAESGVLAAATTVVRQGLFSAATRARELGLPVPDLDGQLYRPHAVLAGACAADYEPDERLWVAALAIQYAHEASLLHDDVIDGAATRRGRPTLARRHGVARALIEGDHLLTAGYRLAAETRSPTFMRLFARCVERTVAGEKRQARARGTVLDWDAYRAIVAGKSGELFGCAVGAAAALGEKADPEPWVDIGRRLGSIYQMVDDLLDYCPRSNTGKAPLGDYRGNIWTWVRIEAPDLRSGREPAEVLEHLFGRRHGTSRMERALDRLAGEIDSVRRDMEGGDGGIVSGMLAAWLARGTRAVREEVVACARDDAATRVRTLTGGRTLAHPAERLAYLAEHGRTFRFAARLFPPPAREDASSVYAFCRLTDDLVDRQPDLPRETRLALLRSWEEAAWRAYQHPDTGIGVLDAAMGTMAARRVPFRYAADLIAGVRMDLEPATFATVDDLRLYTYRVASVVGLWVTELFGVRNPALLERAAALGHAMQLTNILRDVGEDLDRDRLYLPTGLLAAHGLSRAHLDDLRQGNAPIPAAYVEVCETLLTLAERQYAYASEALPALPAFFGRPVAVAARAYAGIHDAIRRNGYDNLRRRAHTTLPEKLWLGIRGVQALQSGRRRPVLRSLTGAASVS